MSEQKVQNCDPMREWGVRAGLKRKIYQNVTVECCNGAKVPKRRLSNAGRERKLQNYNSTGKYSVGTVWERRKAAKMRLLNPVVEQKLPKRDFRILRVSESCKNTIICENGVARRRGRDEKPLKCDCQMLKFSKSCQNVTVES